MLHPYEGSFTIGKLHLSPKQDKIQSKGNMKSPIYSEVPWNIWVINFNYVKTKITPNSSSLQSSAFSRSRHILPPLPYCSTRFNHDPSTALILFNSGKHKLIFSSVNLLISLFSSFKSPDSSPLFSSLFTSYYNRHQFPGLIHGMSYHMPSHRHCVTVSVVVVEWP